MAGLVVIGPLIAAVALISEQ